MPISVLYEEAFSRQRLPFRCEEIVYTEDARGSSPLSPTIFFKDLRGNCEFPFRHVEPTTLFMLDIKVGRSGAPTPSPTLTKANLSRRSAMANSPAITTALFWSKVRVPENRTDCWEWTQTVNGNGYGRYWSDGAWFAAHRFAYEQIKGPIPEGLVVRHMCHNRLCCNPAHLEIGTSKENAQDSIEAGRFTRGAVNGNAKLSDDDVIYIRQNPERLKGAALARKFDVSEATISGIKNGRIWRHV